MPPTEERANSPGSCPDWEPNQRHFACRTTLNPLSRASQGGMSILISITILPNIHLPTPIAAVQAPKKIANGIPDSVLTLHGIKSWALEAEPRSLCQPAATVAALGLLIFPSKLFCK